MATRERGTAPGPMIRAVAASETFGWTFRGLRRCATLAASVAAISGCAIATGRPCDDPLCGAWRSDPFPSSLTTEIRSVETTTIEFLADGTATLTSVHQNITSLGGSPNDLDGCVWTQVSPGWRWTRDADASPPQLTLRHLTRNGTLELTGCAMPWRNSSPHEFPPPYLTDIGGAYALTDDALTLLDLQAGSIPRPVTLSRVR